MKYFISLLIAVSAASQCLAQPFYSLSIYVFEDGEPGKPIAKAKVMIRQTGVSEPTDVDGLAFFEGSMPEGRINYIVSKEGYQSKEGTFNISSEEKSNTEDVGLSRFRDDILLIEGEVIDKDSNDIEGAIVEVKVADVIQKDTTDSSGNYSIQIGTKSKFQVNSLSIEVKKNGCKGRESIMLPRSNIISKNFRLKCDTSLFPPPPPPPPPERFGSFYSTSYWHAKKLNYKPFKNKSSAISQKIIWFGAVGGIAFFTFEQFRLKKKANDFYEQGDIPNNHKYHDMAKKNIWGIIGSGTLLLAVEINFACKKHKYRKSLQN